MLRIEVMSPDGKSHMVIGINREDFEGMISKGTIHIELDEEMKKYDGIFLVGGETDESIEAQLKTEMLRAPGA